RFLGGSAPVDIVAPRAVKTFDLGVVVPIDDMRNPPPPPGAAVADPEAPAEYTEVTGSVWPHVEEAIVDKVLENRSTIVFANSRRLAERLTGRLNEIYSERIGVTLPAQPAPPAARAPAAVAPGGANAPSGGAVGAAQAGSTAGADPVLAKAHHGSVSKEQRAIVE